MDTKVLMTQQWLNETYAGTSGYSAVDEDGITGMGTIRALIWALQTELAFLRMVCLAMALPRHSQP